MQRERERLSLENASRTLEEPSSRRELYSANYVCWYVVIRWKVLHLRVECWVRVTWKVLQLRAECFLRFCRFDLKCWMFVRNDSARVEVKWLSSSRDLQGLFGYVTIFVRKLVILVFNTHENDGTIPRSERRDFEEWRHDGKIEKTYLPLTTTKSKFREQPLWQLHATCTPR